MNSPTAAAKPGLLASLFRKGPKPPTPAQSEYARKYTEDDERRKLAYNVLVSRSAHEVLQEKLAEASLPADVSKVVGKLCSYWVDHVNFLPSPYVSRIVGARLYYNKVELMVDFGPGGVPQKLKYEESGWFCWSDRENRSLLNFQLIEPGS